MERLGYQFADQGLLTRALTHRSYANEGAQSSREHNERLEFLGDAVVDLSVGHLLMEALPRAREGSLSKLRAMVVNEGSLARAAMGMWLGQCLRLGRGEDQSGGRQKPSILADAFEAVIGAIYLDGGFGAADGVVKRELGGLVREAVSGQLNRDHKTRLQELSQARLRQVPQYEVVSERGPEHEKVFEIVVSVDGRTLARATGHSKKDAEQQAAERAIQSLEAEPS